MRREFDIMTMEPLQRQNDGSNDPKMAKLFWIIEKITIQNNVWHCNPGYFHNLPYNHTHTYIYIYYTCLDHLNFLLLERQRPWRKSGQHPGLPSSRQGHRWARRSAIVIKRKSSRTETSQLALLENLVHIIKDHHQPLVDFWLYHWLVVWSIWINIFHHIGNNQ